jgi:hypothetical protein
VSIVVILEWDGVVPTEAQYWELTDKMGLREQLPDGCEVHMAAAEPGQTVRVCEVWASEEAHNRFMEKIGPFFQEIGVPPPSKVTTLPAVRYLATT